MKKFLTVLLALSVVFTYSFATVGTAFADTEYTVATARQELDSLVNPYMESVKAAKGLLNYQYDSETGLCMETGLKSFDKAAVDSAADALVLAAQKAMETEIDTQLGLIDNEIKAGNKVTDLTNYKTAVIEAVTEYKGDPSVDLTTKAGFDKALKADTLTLNKSRELTSYKAIVKKINEDYALSKYPDEGEFEDETGAVEGKYTAQEVVSDAVNAAVKSIEDTHKGIIDKGDSVKVGELTAAVTAYQKAYNSIATYIANFKDNGEGVRTIEQIAEDKDAADKDNAGKFASLKGYALDDYYKTMIAKIVVNKDGTYKLTSFVTALGKTDDKDPLYVPANAAKKTNAVVCGVEVADIAKATKAEYTAVKDAFYKAINDTLAVAEIYAATENADVDKLYSTADTATFTKTIKNALTVADKYAEVKAYGESLKGIYRYGVKIYDDAKVDAVVKAAEALVYADLGGTLKDPEDYILDATEDIYEVRSLTALYVDGADSLETLFKAAQKEAKEKFDGSIITTGVDATPEADKVYKSSLYDLTSVTPDGETYAKIKEDAVDAIEAAQTYEDIDAALATAREKLALLVKKADIKDVNDAKAKYHVALKEYIAEQKALMGSDYDSASFTNVKTAGEALIDEANTVAGVESAYAKAKALVADIKTKADIEAAEEAVKARIKALPYSTQVTAADRDAIEAARAAYDALAKMYGSDAYGCDIPSGAYAKLDEAERALADIDAAALLDELKAMAEKIEAIRSVNNDKAAEDAVALKAEAKALKAKLDAFVEANDMIEGQSQYNFEPYAGILTRFVEESITALETGANTVYAAELYIAEKAIAMLPARISINDKDAVETARALFDALTDVQQYTLQNDGYLYILENAEAQLNKAKIQAVESLKIKASSSAKKGSITVKWTVTGDAVAADGYQVYKSTKANSGYTFMGKTQKTSMVNKKNLKKGTRYFYKVRAYVEIDGVRYYSDWSNKANRYAK